MPIPDFILRHYSYECTVSTQERPYLTRPSRTQQLQNPKLRPKLSSDAPNEVLRTYVEPVLFHSLQIAMALGVLD